VRGSAALLSAQARLSVVVVVVVVVGPAAPAREPER